MIKTDTHKPAHILIEIFALLLLLQGVLALLKHIIVPFFPNTIFNVKMVTMVIMVALTLFLICYSKTKQQKLSVFPGKFGKGYVICTCIVAVLYIATPANFLEGFPAVMSLLYGCIVTPVYEELLFRGYIWEKSKRAIKNEKIIYALNIVLFAVWHIGYMIPQIAVGNWIAVSWKIIAGAGYGLVIGFVRLRTKNCYSTILLHGILNLFMV